MPEFDAQDKQLLLDTAKQVSNLHAQFCENGYMAKINKVVDAVAEINVWKNDFEARRLESCPYKQYTETAQEAAVEKVQKATDARLRKLEIKMMAVGLLLTFLMGVPGVIKAVREGRDNVETYQTLNAEQVQSPAATAERY